MSQIPAVVCLDGVTPSTISESEDKSSSMKKSLHRRMASFPILDEIVAKGKQLLSSSSDSSSVLQSAPSDDSHQITVISSSSTTSPVVSARNSLAPAGSSSSSVLSGTIDTVQDKSASTQTAGECLPTSESNSRTMVIVTSPSFVDELSAQNGGDNSSPPIQSIESSDKFSPISSSLLQTKQRRIDHRRNKSEPVSTGSVEDLSTVNNTSTPLPSTAAILESSSASTTSNESAVGGGSTNAFSIENKKRFSSSKIVANQKQPSLSTSTDKQSSSTKKKKPWYYPFQSTYRQRSEEFRRLFKDIPADERLIVDYSCAWQKEILIQGRMYLSQSYLCFHANFLKWETNLCLRFKDLTAITREKTAKVIPNAIELRSNKPEKYFFASFATRDKTYTMMSRIWKLALEDQTLSAQQLWSMVHESYGNDLDMTTDEEDTYHKQRSSPSSEKSSPRQQTNDNIIGKYDRITPASIRSKSSRKREGDEGDDRSSVSSEGGAIRDQHSVSKDHSTDDDDEDDDDEDDDEGAQIPIGEEATTSTLLRQPAASSLKEETPTTPVNMTYLSTCPCQSHMATQLIDRIYPIQVDRLFDRIFGKTDFLAAHRESRRMKDYLAREWEVNRETGKRERVCTFKVSVAAVLGSTTICSTEKQTIDCELPKSHYIIDTEVRNEGIKYADTFYVASRYCLVQIGPNKSNLRVTSEVRYVKSLMVIIKSFIEKNAMAALQDSFTDLNNRLDLSTSSVKRLEQDASNRPRASGNVAHGQKETNLQTPQITKKKSSRKHQAPEPPSVSSSTNKHRKHSSQDLSLNNNDHTCLPSSSSVSIESSRWFSLSNSMIPLCFLMMILLLFVNIFLCVKLNQIDRMTDRIMQSYPLWLNGNPYPREDSEWSSLLHRQEQFYQTQLTGLRSVLTSTHNALRNVTDALSELSKVTSGSSSKASIPQMNSQ